MRQREVSIRGRKIDSSSRKPRVYGKGRTCSLCGCDLNSWNPGENCAPHTHAVFRKYRARHKGSAA